MKYVFLTLLSLFIIGCSTQPRTIVSEQTGEVVAGAKPAGYPKTSVKALPDQPGFCVEVSEDWVKRNRDGETVWLKEKTVQSVSCTRTRWEHLAKYR